MQRQPFPEPDPAAPRLEISVAGQTLRLIQGGEVARTYPISTSMFGTGEEEGSHKTPTGRFCIAEKIGAGAPPGTIFKSREPEGIWAGEEVEADMVLTRILWLDGLEPHNANTKDRYIYIHGTNDEAGIGKPKSIGCIRMTNADVADLFDRVEAARRSGSAEGGASAVRPPRPTTRSHRRTSRSGWRLRSAAIRFGAAGAERLGAAFFGVAGADLRVIRARRDERMDESGGVGTAAR
ncbi:MAG: L,D-transpeptidase [Verrucomicrobiales bacterium]